MQRSFILTSLPGFQAHIEKQGGFAGSVVDSRFNLRCTSKVTIARLFVSDEHIQRIQNELQPLRKQILDVEQSVAEGKRKVNRSKAEFAATLAPVRSSFRGEPRPRDVTNVLQISRNQLRQLEANQTATRPAIVQQGPPARIRQYMKGRCTVACLRLCMMCDNLFWFVITIIIILFKCQLLY